MHQALVRADEAVALADLGRAAGDGDDEGLRAWRGRGGVRGFGNLLYKFKVFG
jgi:hypothetical protein